MSIPLYLLTLNCGKLQINTADFADNLQQSLPDAPSDLFVFGFQEICSIMDGTFAPSARKHMFDINRIVLHALNTKYNGPADADLAFTTLGVHHVGVIGMILVTPFALKFGTCRFADASCGNAKSLLKGAVGIRVSYSAADSLLTELTFATAHLSAFEGSFYYERRIQNIQTLMRALDFGDGFSFLKPGSHAFFMGDLNFRTTQDPKNYEAALGELVQLQDNTKQLEPNIVPSLVAKYDELTRGRTEGELFSGFDEPCITFHPTYKFHLNTAIYNSKRCPLWCDRILYQSTYKKGKVPVIHEYNSASTYLRSDHRPVYLKITVPLEAPESIIAENGYFVVLPAASHLAHNSQLEGFDPNTAVSGPTQVYMKFTALDRLHQYAFRRIADLGIGYGLWLATTTRGRLVVFVLALMAWLLYAM
ncbi:DNase I-like protein [Metschnikowia bicuspidata var. bicuspidata NRRL YB-4993]|uniref:DNase I-like protein n=1 Tax=Metschnikowia bicuspidata var. bicuspidata NRRL YB-4993 TaxID=869754 RepID=A0A1A0HD24_9ASCO|nr:DNase I-like protein [Metschnikowia bicuspidata var. bicuspidata NRRL YB-4993]OBA21843.1 DNase I-like protein [Metschnikowia bicuspidata var. bicuspidata NRRL YB-4993]